MTPLVIIPNLVANTDISWIRAARPVAESAGEASLGLIVTAAVVATVAALLMTWLLRLDRARHGPTLRRLARSLGVGFAERRLLQRVAHHGGFATAGSLLVSRGCFEKAVREWPGDAQRLAAIRRTVFAGSR